MNKDRVAQLIRELLVEIGEDPEREGLLKTPDRVARAYEFLTAGYRASSSPSSTTPCSSRNRTT